jgi:hypothetical protein
MPEIASQQFAMLRILFVVARRCDNTRSEASWANEPRSDTRPRWRPRVRFGGERNASVTSWRLTRTTRDQPF